MEKFRFYALIVSFVSSVVLLQACGGSSDTPASGGNPVVPAGVSLNTVGDKIVAPGATINFTVSASNPDNNSITFSTNTSHAIYMSQGASFNATTRQFSWTPAAEGVHQITFTVTNNDVTPAVSDSETITINVSSRVQLNSIGNKTVGPGGSLNFTVTAFNPDNNSVTLSADLSQATGATFNPGNGQFSWTPSAEGSHQVIFTVTDNDASPVVTDSETITIDVSSRVQLNAIGNKSVTLGGSLNFTVSASNPDNNSISFSTDTTHTIYTTQNAMFTSATGEFSWTPAVAGNHSVSFTVTNNDVLAMDSETISINVQEVIDTTIADGEALYIQHCQSCHGVNGSGGSRSLVVGTAPLYVKEALDIIQSNAGVSQMLNIPGRMTDPVNDSNAIGFFLCNLDPNIDYTNVNECPVN